MRILYRIIFTLLFVYSLVLNCYSQIELQKIAPLAPNTASLLRVSENKINHYTGSADISFPIYTINSGSLSLNLSLTYNSSGNKVEDIASWVGLGWSLGSLPLVSRSVRGLPDEFYPGVSVPFGGSVSLDSIARILEEDMQSNPHWGNIVCQISNRELDVDPDIFSYTLLDGRSGTFYWDQKRQKYQTQPYRNFKITKTGAGSIDAITILDDNGNTYIFNEYETSQSSGSFLSEETRNSWYVSKVLNANKTDSILFGYANHTIVTKTLNPHKKYIQGDCPDNSSIIATTTLKAKILFTIIFKNGYVEFDGEGTREDLQGSYALSDIRIFNFKNQLIKKFKLNYFYTTGSTSDPLCNMISSFSYEKKRLFLQNFVEKGNGSDSAKYSFTYNTTITAPCRVSSAQDFWGYFNGETNNQNLIPELPAIYGYSLMISGAKRYVNPNKNQFGILKQIVYPTGGKSLFEYETHKIISSALPGVYFQNSVFLTPENMTSPNVYIDTIELHSDFDKYINNSANGGSFVDIILGDKECTGDNPPPNCAQFYVRGIETSNSDINFPVSQNILGHKLKKGKYEIKASFGQPHSTAQGFFMLVKWKEVDYSYKNKYVGGLRVKKITQSDSLGNHYTKNFLYQKSLSNDSSSGISLSSENLFKEGMAGCYDYTENSSTTATFVYQESNGVLTSFNGSHVAYNKVFEIQDSLGNNGYREFQFLPFENIFLDYLPYTPPANTNEFRAKPILISEYNKKQGVYKKVREQTFLYDEIFLDGISSKSVWTYPVAPAGSCGTPGPNYVGLLFLQDIYETVPAICNLRESVTKIFDTDNNIVLIDTLNYYYNTKNYELLKEVSKNSMGKQFEKFSYYSIDSSASGLDANAWQNMNIKNMIGIPTKSIVKIDGSLNNTQLNKYSYESAGNKILLKEIHQAIKNSPLSKEVSFTYSSADNIIEQAKTNNVNEAYLWGYGGRYPVAKIINSTFTTSSSFINQSTLDNPSTTDVQMRTELNKIRTGLASSSAQVYTYTYKPLVGLTSETDPNGRTTYYEYDGFNRLSIIKDHENKILKKYCYNYAGQAVACSTFVNSVQSGTYTRNNCGTGYTGSSVTYTVPAGTYSSSISTADANQQAQNDVTANGQAYANANGTCTQSSGPVTITLKNMFMDVDFPEATVEFIQNGVVVQTKTFPPTKNGTNTYSNLLTSGTYQLRFTVPTEFTYEYSSFMLNPGGYFWDKLSGTTTYTTTPVTLSPNTTYTITSSEAM